MKSASHVKMTRILSRAALSLQFLVGVSASAQALSPEEIIERAAEVNGRDWATIHSFDYFMSTRDGEETKTFEVHMVEGSRCTRLVAIDDKSLSPKDESKVKREFEATVGRRRGESTSERARRVEEYEKEMKQYRVFVEEMIKAFDFTSTGKQMLGQHEAYVLSGKPRPSYHPPNKFARALTGMQGTVWIKTDDFHLLKLEAEVVSPVRIESFVAQIEPGTQLVLEQAPTTAGPWMPSHFWMKAEARVLFLFPHHERHDNTYFNYYKPDANSASPTISRDGAVTSGE
jgi:hypothetical protein